MFIVRLVGVTFSQQSCQRGMMGAATKQEVVIKTLKPGSSEIAARDLDRELEVLKVLHHSNIVEFFGTGHAPQVRQLSTIFEHCRGSSCIAYLTLPPYRSKKFAPVIDVFRGGQQNHSGIREFLIHHHCRVCCTQS